jgi:GWxTD domain-containing protein
MHKLNIRKWIGIQLVNFILIIVIPLFAQLPEYTTIQEEGVPQFSFDLHTKASEDTGYTNVQVFMKIAFDELQFIHKEEKYEANYELTVSFFDLEGTQIDGKIIKKQVIVDYYTQTNSRKDFSFTEMEFRFLPGEYEMFIGLLDQDSKRSGFRRIKLNIYDYFQQPLDISDLSLLNLVFTDSDGNPQFEPNVFWNMNESQESVTVLFELYDQWGLDSVQVNYQLQSLKEDKVLRDVSFYHPVEKGRNPISFELIKGGLQSGKYRIRVSIGKKEWEIKRTRTISIHWFDMPIFAEDLDKAIDQLRYIAKRKEMKRMKKAKTDDKERLFEEFWQERDPTPDTEANELMREYYRRVDYAGAHFGNHREGWLTDRGMVYITLGPPNDIDRHPFDPDTKPYEVWYYYKFNTHLVFIDYTGYGEYKMDPNYWEIFHQMR